jgi:hypothetical protein
MKRFLIPLLLLLLVTPAHAVPTYAYTLDSLTSQTSGHTGSTTTISSYVKACAAWLHTVKNSGTNPTLDAKIQYSPDGSTWFDLGSFQQDTATHDQMMHFDSTVTRIFTKVRSVTTLGGTSPNFDYTIKMYCE